MYLVVVRVRDESSADTEQSEGFNLEVSRLVRDVGLVQGDHTVVLFIHILEGKSERRNLLLNNATSYSDLDLIDGLKFT